MTAPESSRQAILDRIRTATQPVAKVSGELPESWASLPRDYVRAGQLSPQDRIQLMLHRLREYDAEVVESTPAQLPAAIAAQLASSGKTLFVAPPGLPPEWLAPGCDWKIDRNLSTDEIEQAEGVLTASSCGIADSGTIVLHHSPSEGRRLITLLPDWHLCVLRTTQVVETLPEYFHRFPQPPSLLTTISGPSATADIEMTRIKGVHGPRFLHVILVHDHPAAALDDSPAQAASLKDN